MYGLRKPYLLPSSGPRFRRQPREDGFADIARCRQRRFGLLALRLIGFARISKLPSVFRQRRCLLSDWRQRCVQRHAALAEILKIVRLPKRHIVPCEEGLQRLFRRLLAMERDIASPARTS